MRQNKYDCPRNSTTYTLLFHWSAQASERVKSINSYRRRQPSNSAGHSRHSRDTPPVASCIWIRSRSSNSRSKSAMSRSRIEALDSNLPYLWRPLPLPISTPSSYMNVPWLTLTCWLTKALTTGAYTINSVPGLLRHLIGRHCNKSWSEVVRVCKQRALTSLTHNYTARILLTADSRTLMMRESMNLPGAKEWLLEPPSSGLQTHIADSSFRKWFKYCSLALRRAGTTCYLGGCTRPLDIHGDRFLVFPAATEQRIAPSTRRNDKLVNAIGRVSWTGHHTPIFEPRDRITEGNNLRPDIRCLGAEGGEDLLDIFVRLSNTQYGSTSYRSAQGRLNIRCNEKMKKDETYAKSIPGARAEPIFIAPTGGWHEITRELIKTRHGNRRIVQSTICKSRVAHISTPRRNPHQHQRSVSTHWVLQRWPDKHSSSKLAHPTPDNALTLRRTRVTHA